MGAGLGTCCGTGDGPSESAVQSRKAAYAVPGSATGKGDGQGPANKTGSVIKSSGPLPYQVYFLSPPGAPARDPATLAGAVLEEDPEMASILRLCASMFQATVALTAIFDSHRVYVSSAAGGVLPASADPDRWRWTLCAWTAAHEQAGGQAGGKAQMLVVPDTLQDDRFREHAEGSPGVRFFCGAPLIAADGHRLGTLCFMDVAPRPGFDAASCSAMNNLTALVVRHLEKGIALKAKEADNEVLKATYGQMQRTLDCFEHCVVLLDTAVEGWKVLHANSAWAKLTGVERSTVVGQVLSEVFEAAGGVAVPSQELVEAAEDGCDFQVTAAKLRLQSPLGTPKGGFMLNFRPASSRDGPDSAMGGTAGGRMQAMPEFMQLPVASVDASGSCSPFTAGPQTNRFYFMSVDLAGRASTSRASAALPTLTTAWSANGAEVVEGLVLSNLLGKGSFGSVYYGIWMGTPVAVKIMDSDVKATVTTRGSTAGAAGQAVAEAVLGQQLRHPNIVATLKWAARRLDRPNANTVIRSTFAEQDTSATGRNTVGAPAPPSGVVSRSTMSPAASSAGPYSATSPTAAHPPAASTSAASTSAASPPPPPAPPPPPPASTLTTTGAAATAGMWAVMDYADQRFNELDDGDNEDGGDGDGDGGGVGVMGRIGPMIGGSIVSTHNALASTIVSAGANATNTTTSGFTPIVTNTNNAASANTAPSNVTGATTGHVNVNGGGGGGANSLMGASNIMSADWPGLAHSGGYAQVPSAVKSFNAAAFTGGARICSSHNSSHNNTGYGAAAERGGRAPGRAGSSHRGSLDEGGMVQTWIVMEYCDKGCLQDAIERGWLRTERSAVSGRPNLKAVLATAREVASALAYLHAANVVHGDLSGWNVMLCSAGGGGGDEATTGGRGFVAKVADFGLSRTLEIRSKMQTASYGTLSHMPPELVLHGTMSRAVDVYSYGVLLWQMYTGARPWAGMNPSQIIMMIGNGSARLSFPPGTPPSYEALMRECTATDPERRPAFTDVVRRLEQQLNDLDGYETLE